MGTQSHRPASSSSRMPQRAQSAMPSSFVNPEDYGNEANHLLASLFDSVQSGHGAIIDNQIVGIYIHSVNSTIRKPALSSSYTNTTDRESILKLDNKGISQTWVKNNGFTRQLQVTTSPLQVTTTLSQFNANILPVMRF